MSDVEYRYAPKAGKPREGDSVRGNFEVLEGSFGAISDENIERSSVNTRHLSLADGAFKAVVSDVQTLGPNASGAMGVDTVLLTATVTCDVGTPVLVTGQVQFRIRDIGAFNGNGACSLDLDIQHLGAITSSRMLLGAEPDYVAASAAAIEMTTVPVFGMFTSTHPSHTISIVAKAGAGITENYDFRHEDSSLIAFALGT